MSHRQPLLLPLWIILLSIPFSETIPAGEIVTLDLVVSTPDLPRHDHQLIFPLKDGKLLLVWSEYYRTPETQPGAQRDNMPCRIAAMVSSDRGRTWTDRRVLQPNIGKYNVKHPNLLRLPDGDVLLFFTAWNSMQDRTVYMRRSSDDCQTWTEPIKVSTLPGINNINSDHVSILKSQRIILPAFNSPHYGQGDHWQAFCYFSDDLGKSWRISDTYVDLPKRGAEEPTIVARNDDSLLMLLRTSLGSIYQATSDDAGTNWSSPTSTGLEAPASPPIVKRIPQTGDLLLVWNRNYEPKQHHQGNRNPLNSAISRDDGKTWEHIKELERVPGGAAAYAAVSFQEDEALVTYYYQKQGFGGASGIRLKIVPIEWFYE